MEITDTDIWLTHPGHLLPGGSPHYYHDQAKQGKARQGKAGQSTDSWNLDCRLMLLKTLVTRVHVGQPLITSGLVWNYLRIDTPGE